MTDTKTPDLDRALGFTIPAQHARGRVVRLGPTLDTILAAHAYPPAIEKLLAEALTLTALIGSTLKDPQGQLTMQTQTEAGVVTLLVCDYRGGEVRGYIQYDAERLTDAPAEPSLFALFGKGYLAITFDLATTGERYQGIVPLDGDTLSEAAQSYFYQSEQIPTLVRVGLRPTLPGAAFSTRCRRLPASTAVGRRPRSSPTEPASALRPTARRTRPATAGCSSRP